MLPFMDDPDFPMALKQARIHSGISYAELGRKVGIAPAMPARYERGESQPTEMTWHKLNQVLFGESAVVDASGEVSKSLASATVVELVEELKKRGVSKVELHFD
ncbi:helix-turn-helix domain-containing protein [Vibrio astriarenae]|uniref:Helix-turn-helix domain-containing protein n=1 Tax=Vibrio astriarenae TaxID=1481923 RepID=A0A7Z2T4V9_9VIBR|nr:helix-turn-helix transcriptional regulator [Vibrio astriarenae]QIA64271.1 helix-turn-helix domain-containing protein [Vibrio astriarenae]